MPWSTHATAHSLSRRSRTASVSQASTSASRTILSVAAGPRPVMSVQVDERRPAHDLRQPDRGRRGDPLGRGGQPVAHRRLVGGVGHVDLEVAHERAPDLHEPAQPRGHPGGARAVRQPVEHRDRRLAHRLGPVVQRPLEERLVGGREPGAEGAQRVGCAPWPTPSTTAPRAARGRPPASARRPSANAVTASALDIVGHASTQSAATSRRGSSSSPVEHARPRLVEPGQPAPALAERHRRAGPTRRRPAAKSSSAGQQRPRHALAGGVGQPQPLHDELVARRLARPATG